MTSDAKTVLPAARAANVSSRAGQMIGLAALLAFAIALPFLDDHVLPMAIGLELDTTRLKAGNVHRVTMRHRTVLPEFGVGKTQRCYALKETVVGGFTLEFQTPQGRPRRS